MIRSDWAAVGGDLSWVVACWISFWIWAGDGPAVLGCGGVEEFCEDEFVEDLLAVGFGELGPEFLLGNWFAVDEGDGFGGGLWGGSGLGLGAADEKCAQECR